jgi:hypothetical protein
VTECGGGGGDDDGGGGGPGGGGGYGIGRCASRWTATRTCASPASGTPSSPSERPLRVLYIMFRYPVRYPEPYNEKNEEEQEMANVFM